METSQTVLGGLPYDLISVSYFRLVGYILLLLLGDCAGGIPASRLILKPQAFLLIRAGWKRWFGLTLRRCFCAVFAACMLWGRRQQKAGRDSVLPFAVGGGVSSLADVESLRKMNLYGAIIGKAYYTGDIDLKKAIEVAR